MAVDPGFCWGQLRGVPWDWEASHPAGASEGLGPGWEDGSDPAQIQVQTQGSAGGDVSLAVESLSRV